jgi:hypothetical protein
MSTINKQTTDFEEMQKLCISFEQKKKSREADLTEAKAQLDREKAQRAILKKQRKVLKQEFKKQIKSIKRKLEEADSQVNSAQTKVLVIEEEMSSGYVKFHTDLHKIIKKQIN